MGMATMSHGHQEMHREHDYYERKQCEVAFNAECWCKKDEKKRKSATEYHPYPMIFHD
jgi:hypothetical protein